ncbi:MAG: hypothetical protein DRH30_06755 [Deltaproteobacteria bacterium]|nr:MAG: hypothetical protein DRH30_06755 [Deltaproteobacteria bacterium]
MILEEYAAILDKARQRRADTIGYAARKHPIIAVLVAAVLFVPVPIMLTQVEWNPSVPVAMR